MTPPIWLDDYDQPSPTRPCPKCGREDLVLRLRYEHLFSAYPTWAGRFPYARLNRSFVIASRRRAKKDGEASAAA
jgi:hypothetical protein